MESSSYLLPYPLKCPEGHLLLWSTICPPVCSKMEHTPSNRARQVKIRYLRISISRKGTLSLFLDGYFRDPPPSIVSSLIPFFLQILSGFDPQVGDCLVSRYGGTPAHLVDYIVHYVVYYKGSIDSGTDNF